MRWFFILLLLVNALFLGWQLQKNRTEAVQPLADNVARIRLLSEVDSSLLLPRQELVSATAAEDDKAEPVDNDPWCQVVSGIHNPDTADELVARLQQAGLSAVIEPLDEERVLAYELTLGQPESESEQQAMISNLRELGHTAELIELNRKPAYVIGRYPTRTEMNQARSLLVGLFEPGIYQVVAKDNQYKVWVELDVDLESGNKINQLAEYFPRGIKIEKKLCKGVASTGARE